MRKGIIILATLAACVAAPLSAFALSIAPPRFEMVASPGDVVLDVVRLYNETNEPITLYPLVRDFIDDESESGVPRFVSEGQERGGTGLASWITVPPGPITLAPQERGNLEFSINIPKENVQPGGHYGAIFLADSPDGDDETIGVSGQLGALILLRVEGEVREAGTIAEFGFKEPRAWYEHRPIDFFLRFENSGNVHLLPAGSIDIRDWLGRTVAIIPVNPESGSVLPRSIRKFEASWGSTAPRGASGLEKEWNGFALGKHTATLRATYGTDGKIVTEELHFSVWPWRLLSFAACVLLAAIAMIRMASAIHARSVIRRHERKKNE